MKKYFILLLILFTVCGARAQVYRTFLDVDDKRIDSVKALSYILVRQVSDTSWLMQQYDMHNSIMQAGTFKDKSLHIPHGKFVYYNKFYTYRMKWSRGFKPPDTSNYLRGYGEYKDGKKNGWWIDYYRNGNKDRAEYYKNGLLDGPYEAYNHDTNTIFTAGNYVNDKREGEWDILSQKGDTLEKDMYFNGKVFERHQQLKQFVAAASPVDFIGMIEEKVTRLINETDHFKVLIGFDITPEGKVINPKIIGRGYNKSFDKQLLEILSSSPVWVPANSGDPAKPIQDFSAVNIEADNRHVLAILVNYGNSKQMYYNMTH